MTWAEVKKAIEKTGVQDEMIIDEINICNPDAINAWIPSGDECANNFGIVINNLD